MQNKASPKYNDDISSLTPQYLIPGETHQLGAGKGGGGEGGNIMYVAVFIAPNPHTKTPFQWLDRVESHQERG
jgi:hypothetical protein